MKKRNRSSLPRYTRTAMGFHWLMAVLVAVMLGVGLTMTGMDNTMAKFEVYQVHKSVGLTVLMLALARLMWRFTHPAPMLPKGMPAWQKAGAHASHWLLYGLMVGMPLSGWVFSDAAGYHPSWFGLAVPVLVEGNREVAAWGNQLHAWGGWTLLALVCAHVGAAVYHHLVKRDDVLVRMLPGWVRVPRPRVLGILLPGLLLAPAAQAMDWDIDPTVSRIDWQAGFNGQPVKGTFRNWYGKIFFNPDVPEATEIEITVQMASVDSGDIGRDQTLKGADWFDVVNIPHAVFTTTKVKKLDAYTYQAEGKLTMTGISKPLAFPFRLEIIGDRARASGSFVLLRTDYILGRGPWEKSQEIGNKVRVNFVVNATKSQK